MIRRSKPLRRTPLPRSTSEIKRTPLRRSSKPIPARSQRREAIADERRQFVDRVLHARPWCEACPTLAPARRPNPTCDVHELVRRSQGSPIVPSQGLADDDVLSLCRVCHSWITTHPADAVALGLARWGMRTPEQ